MKAASESDKHKRHVDMCDIMGRIENGECYCDRFNFIPRLKKDVINID
jgi:hypothetical protein